MSRLIFARRCGPRWAARAACGCAVTAAAPAVAAAQWVPGRDLLDFPIATVAEAPALATRARIGLWNPAAIASRGSARASFGVAALSTPADQGVSAQVLGAAVQVPARATVAISVARASVSDILLTDEDPRSLGEVRYATTLVSAMVAGRSHDHLATGLALRYRAGQVGSMSRGAVALDGGVLLDGLGPRDARLAASTFLWTPANRGDERAAYLAAGDLRVAGPDTARELRAGYSYGATERGPREHFGFASGRYGAWEGRGGVVRSAAYGDSRWRLRLGLGVYYARYAVAVAREDGGGALPATYQFSLSSTVR